MKKFLLIVFIGMLCAAGYMTYQGQQEKTGQIAGKTLILTNEASEDQSMQSAQTDQPDATGEESVQADQPDATEEAVQADQSDNAGTADVQEADIVTSADELLAYVRQQFDVELSPEDAQKLMDTIGKLEKLGVSPDVVKEKAVELYEEYGKEWVEHAEEAVTDAVKNAAGNAVDSFTDGLKQSVSDTVDGIFHKP